LSDHKNKVKSVIKAQQVDTVMSDEQRAVKTNLMNQLNQAQQSIQVK